MLGGGKGSWRGWGVVCVCVRMCVKENGGRKKKSLFVSQQNCVRIRYFQLFIDEPVLPVFIAGNCLQVFCQNVITTLIKA